MKKEDLSDHQIIFGDSRKVLKDLPKECVDLVVTSPPYNVDKDYGNTVYDDSGPYGEYLDMLEEVFTHVYDVMKEHRFLLINIGRESVVNTNAHMARILEKIGFKYQNIIIWKKPEGAARQSFTERWPHARWYQPKLVTEQILVYSKGEINGNRPERTDDNRFDKEFYNEYKTNIWEINPANHKEHPAIFPIELPKTAIKFYSQKGERVLDPFGGTCTTSKAAFMEDRKSICIELNQDYENAIRKKLGVGQQKLNGSVDYDVTVW